MFFKSFISKNQKTNGDTIWFSECGNLAILIDAVSISNNPYLTTKEIVSYLNENESILKNLSTSSILININQLLFNINSDLLASICVIKQNGNTIIFSSIGNSQLLEVKKNYVNFILESFNQPEHIVGHDINLIVKENIINLNNNSVYILASDGLSFKDICFETMSNLKTNNDWEIYANNNKREDDWCFCVFPFEKQLSYENHTWPYFPFVGRQEKYEQEKEGLSEIADSLFKDPDFEGFKILGGADISVKNTFRKMDGILISPYGVVLLELKDWRGNITIPIEGSRSLMYANDNGEEKSETSPIFKINEAMDEFTGWSIFSNIRLPEKRIAAIIFTHENVNINCVNSSGNVVNDIYKVGYTIISKTCDLAEILKKYWQKDISNGKKYKLSLSQINEICDNYLVPINSTENAITKIAIKGGKYQFILNDLNEDFSTDYYKLYKGYDTRKNSLVWIKEYELTTISKGSLEDEANRIQREVEALQYLSKSDNIQDFKGDDLIDTKLYIILEYIDGMILEEYLEKSSSQLDKLNIIYEIILILKELEKENIVHRSINPKNIIIKNNSTPVLINFELCKLDFLPTLPPRGRRLLDSAYEAREININTSGDITISSDIFSVGQLICKMLKGSLLFSNSAQRAKITRDKNWSQELVKDCKLPNYASAQLKSILSNDPVSRPTVDEFIEYIKQWIKDVNQDDK